jgi:hypothetical protein
MVVWRATVVAAHVQLCINASTTQYHLCCSHHLLHVILHVSLLCAPPYATADDDSAASAAVQLVNTDHNVTLLTCRDGNGSVGQGMFCKLALVRNFLRNF